MRIYWVVIHITDREVGFLDIDVRPDHAPYAYGSSNPINLGTSQIAMAQSPK